MASKEFHAMQEAMAARPVPPPPADIAEQRSRIDEAMAQMPLAEGTVAEPFVRSGVPGIECRPVDVADNAPIGRGAEPQVLMTVASTTRWPPATQSRAVRITCKSTLSIAVPYTNHRQIIIVARRMG